MRDLIGRGLAGAAGLFRRHGDDMSDAMRNTASNVSVSSDRINRELTTGFSSSLNRRGSVLRSSMTTQEKILRESVTRQSATLSRFEQQMVLYSDDIGNTANTRTPVYRFGPYIAAMPRLPVGTNQGKTSVTAAGTYADGHGWAYDQLTGDFRANLPDSDVDEDRVRFNTY